MPGAGMLVVDPLWLACPASVGQGAATFQSSKCASDMSVALLPVRRQLFIRAIVWAVIGAIYAPVFVIFEGLAAPYLGPYAMVLAATAAGAIGAAYYGARQAALVASLVGVVATLFVLVSFYDRASFWHAALLCGALGMLTGLIFKFPRRCTAHVVGKVLVGGASGFVSGAGLTTAALLGLSVSPLVAVAFLVSVNGTIYVALVRRITQSTGLLPARWCPIAEGAVIGVTATFVAGTIWAFTSTLSGVERQDLFLAVVSSTSQIMPLAVGSGIVAGTVTGVMLELFGFEWIDDL